MIPPEPGPDPPTPPVEPTVYTYASTSQISIGDTTGNVYDGMWAAENQMAYISASIDGGYATALHTLIVNEVPAFQETNYYFCLPGLSCCVLASNATIGGTHPYYRYDSTNHTMVQAGTVEILSSRPSDYFDNIKSGNFELEQRS